jgi:hypothetical protein
MRRDGQRDRPGGKAVGGSDVLAIVGFGRFLRCCTRDMAMPYRECGCECIHLISNTHRPKNSSINSARIA